MNTFTRRRWLAFSSAALAAGASSRGAAQVIDGLRSIHLVVPTPPGTQPDLIARWLIQPMAQMAGVPGQVLNRPGAAGALAADAVLSAAPDTGTLLLGGLDHVAYSHLNSQRKALDPLVDFVPVGAINRDTWLLVASRDTAVSDVAGLVALSRRGTALSYASAGEGTTPHLVTARLCKALGIEAQHVPYKESYQPDLIAGRIQFAVAPTPALLGLIRSNRVQPLASLTSERLEAMPQVPSIRETGWPDQIFHGGLYLFAPTALARHASVINGWPAEALRRPDIVANYRQASIEPTPLSLEQVRVSVSERLQSSDAMRMAVFGRTR